MAETDYVTAFRKLAQALHRAPDVVLLGFHTFAPLSAVELEALAERHRCELDPALRTFYQQTNGLQLRWMLRDNPAYDPQKYPPHQDNRPPVPWNYATEHYRAEEGCILLLPLDELLTTALPPVWTTVALRVAGQSYTPLAFYEALRPLDRFSSYDSTALLLRPKAPPLVLLCEEQGEWAQGSAAVPFGQYLSFLYASLGTCLRRREWMTLSPLLDVRDCRPFWTLERLRLSKQFPLADQPGQPSTQVKTRAMQKKALQQPLLPPEEWQTLVDAHDVFLDAGGRGGKWSIVALQGRTMGIYQSGHQGGGQQALLDMKRVDKDLDFQGLHLPYSSWCGAYAKGQDWSDADLTGSLFVDAQLERAVFAEANLENVDFSRANLRQASFINANLTGADFEGCDLTGADFRGALLTGSRFKGTHLSKVRR